MHTCGYIQVECQPMSSQYYGEPPWMVAPPDTHHVTLSGLEPGSKYQCSVAARTSKGYGDKANYIIWTKPYSKLCFVNFTTLLISVCKFPCIVFPNNTCPHCRDKPHTCCDVIIMYCVLQSPRVPQCQSWWRPRLQTTQWRWSSSPLTSKWTLRRGESHSECAV